jgi:hypothetical protein
MGKNVIFVACIRDKDLAWIKELRSTGGALSGHVTWNFPLSPARDELAARLRQRPSPSIALDNIERHQSNYELHRIGRVYSRVQDGVSRPRLQTIARSM